MGNVVQTLTSGQTVLIVGAGPTGLLLGADLARRGIACRIIEEASVRQTAPRAINLHPRSMEVFDDLGIAEEALALGNQVLRLNTYAAIEPVPGRPPRRLGQIDLSKLPSRFPFTLTLQQPITERLLEENAARHGVSVERRVRFAGLSQDDSGVTVCLEHLANGACEYARVGWVVGCDGIYSTVRDALNIAFEGITYDADLAGVDVELDWVYPHDEAHVFMSPAGTLRCMPVPGDSRWRIMADVPRVEDGQPRKELTLYGYEGLVHERGVDVTLRKSHWMTNFHIHKRIADRYRDGRVLLAGDAVHVHSPSGAQGMNMGMQDAYNLGWKLAQVIAGTSRPELLDTYERERRPVALRTLRTTDRSVRRLELRSPVARSVRNSVSRVVLRIPALHRRMAEEGAQLSIHYPASSLTAECWRGRRRGPRAGERAPDVRFGPPTARRTTHELLRGTGHVLFLFAGADSASAVTLTGLASTVAQRRDRELTWYLAVRDPGEAQGLDLGSRLLIDPDGALHAGWGAPAGSLYLIRPDGHIAYRSWPADAARLENHLDRIFS